MSSKKKSNTKTWFDTFRFRKQTLVGKIILISGVLIFGTTLIYVLITSAMNRWDELGIYSVWMLFGWLFFVILIYVSFKLISLLMHKEKIDTQKFTNTEIDFDEKINSETK